ncbi:MAG: hypothetical protein EHM21_13110, partial [Chloroflexi bacterium]
MFTPEELRAFADLLRNNFTTSTLPSERQQELLLRGIIASLEEWVMSDEAEDSSSLTHPSLITPSPIDLLYQTAARHPIQGVRGQTSQALVRLSLEGQGSVREAAIDSLYRLAVEDSLPAARQRILTQGWQPGRPALRALFEWFTCLGENTPYPEENIPLLTQGYFEEASPEVQRRLLVTAPQNGMENWGRIIAAVQEGAEGPLLELVERYPSFRPAERAIFLEQLDRLAGSSATVDSGAAARSALALLFIRHEDPGARQLVLERGFLPEDPEQRALFLFLAEAWQPYEALDFDHHLLVNAYEAAGRSLRRRLLEHSRHTGQLDWLRGMTSGGTATAVEVRWLVDLTDADWDLTIRRLSENEKDADLWRLAQFAPPVWSATILDRLARRGWQPDNEEERGGFSRLVGLARESLGSPLAIHPLKTLYVPPISEVTCLAMHPSGRILAAGRSDQYILQWDLPAEDLLPTMLIGPAPVTRALAFSPDGEL